MRTDLTSVGLYLSALAARRPVALLDPGLSTDALPELADRYRPALIAGFDIGDLPGYLEQAPGVHRSAGDPAPVHPDLALLLPTSGSTGSPKLVRLSRAAVLANAHSIAAALAIGPDDVAPTSLPLHYSYGLSVLNSHLHAGATVALIPHSLVERPFWTAMTERGCTTLAAVPYQYEMLARLRADPRRCPTLTTLTQAGGRLRTDLIQHFSSLVDRFFVMYGQTEATARIAILPAGRLADKLGSAGRAIPGGALSTTDDGEIVYDGPNVMMGYAESADDLACDDVMRGRLPTGDLGHLDGEGFLYVTGRMKRIAKVFGVRVNLDDVERLLRGSGPVAAVSGDDRLVVYAEGADAAACATLTARLSSLLNMHWSGFDVRALDRLPVLATGKIDYRTLERLCSR
ncbi:AMP-binding protein [Streptosporangiaceae bacterium NEAU-GS5]|nr:AMP-binding protein [Streptosporangiaceae bacterium NEAU-GS5]